jgi:replicative DNA helicase
VEEAVGEGGAFAGQSVHFFSYEEPWPVLALKLLMIRSGRVLDSAANQAAFERVVRSGRCDDGVLLEAQRWLRAALDSRRLVLHDEPLSVGEVVGRVRGAEPRAGVVFVDYIQKVPPGGSVLVERYRQVQLVSEEFRKLASMDSIPVVVGAQLSRSLYAKRGGAAGGDRGSFSAIRESSDVNQDASLVLLLELQKRVQAVRATPLRVTVSKNRGGQAGLEFVLSCDLVSKRVSDGVSAVVNLEPVRPPRYAGRGRFEVPNRAASLEQRFDVAWVD